MTSSRGRWEHVYASGWSKCIIYLLPLVVLVVALMKAASFSVGEIRPTSASSPSAFNAESEAKSVKILSKEALCTSLSDAAW